MRNLKKILALVLSLMMVLSVMVTASATYSDADDIQYTEAVEVMSALGILAGTDGKFNPQGTLYRDQAAKIITYIALGADAADLVKGTGSDQFSDVTGGWAYDYVSYCANEGIINGYTVDGKLCFGPGGTLTGYQFGKMLLNVLGIEGTYTGSNWTLNVAKALKNNGLLKNMAKGFSLTNNITREEAAQLAFDAMQYGDTLVGYTVDGDVSGTVYSTYIEALTIWNTLGGSDPATEIIPYYSGSLAEKVYGLYHYETGDAFGRGIRVWVSDNVLDENGEPTKVVIYTENCVATYTAETLASVIANDLKAYKVEGEQDGTPVKVTVSAPNKDDHEIVTTVDVYEDSDSATQVTIDALVVGTPAKTFAGEVAALTDDNATVEVYAADGVITKIVVVNTYADTIASYTKADEKTGTPAYITLENTSLPFESNEFSEKDEGAVVLYTVSNSYSVQSVVKAESVTGVLTSYTKNEVYTIGNATYTVSANPVSGYSFDTDKMGTAWKYYLGMNNTIVAAGAPDGVAPEVISNYAVILKVNVKAKTVSWPVDSTTYTAQVQALLSNGTVGIYDLNLVKAAKDNEVGSVSKDEWYIAIGNTALVVNEDIEANMASGLKDALTAVYTYKLDGTTLNLAGELNDLASSGTVAAVVYEGDADGIKSTTPVVEHSSKNVVYNDATVFILKDATTGSIVVKTGIAALEDTVVNDAKVVVNVTLDATGTASNVAKVVFAQDIAFDAADATVTNKDKIFVDGTDYVITVDAKGDKVYTYAAYNVKGEDIKVTGAADLKSGIYSYTDTNEVTGSVSGAFGTVTAIYGSTYVLNGDTYVTVNAKTDVVGELTVGATICYLATDNTATLIFVVG